MKYVKTVFVYCIMLVQMNGAIVPRQKIKAFFFVAEMTCLLCSLHCSRETILKNIMSIIILSMIKIFFLKIFSHLIQLTRRVEFATKLLKVQEVKKSTCFFSIIENISK